MARIPEIEIERLKQEISLQRLAESAGIALKRHGADLVGLCPFHDDKTPSLVITPKTNLWHCLGACQMGGSVIDWVMKAEGVSFRHAVELLQNDSFSSLAAGSCSSTASVLTPKPVKHSTVQKLPTSLSNNAEDDKLLVQVIDYYHQALKDSPEALAYLQKRGIGSAEAIDHFKLGFANRTLGYRLPLKNRKEGAAIRGQLQRIGLLRASGHEHFNGSIVMPVINEMGQVLEVYGRKINDNLRKGTPTHLYLPGAHAGIWNETALKVCSELILCESLIDALTFWCAGFRNVTASYGIEGFTADHMQALKHYNIQRVLIAYDRDDAGNSAAEKLAEKLIESGIDCYRIHFPKGMDANSYALQVQPANKSLGVVIRSAIWLGKGQGKTITSTASVEPQLENTKTEQAAKNKKSAKPSASETKTNLESESESEQNSNPIPSLAAKIEDEAVVESIVATPVPAKPVSLVEAEIKTLGDAEELVITLGDRRYRIRGLDKNQNYAQLKINLLVSRPAFDGAGGAVHVDTLDCYQSRPRSVFIKQASIELGLKEDIIKHDLGKILLKLESLQEQRLKSLQEPKTKTISLTDEENQTALALLKSPDLLTRIQDDFRHCGIVGEDTNTLTGYLACVSRKLDKPLAILIQSTSAAGKSALMDAVLNLMPEEECIQYSAMTGQSLFYLGETDLKHKILGIAEEEGVSEASYALKLLQSQGELTIATTGKDPESGKMVTQEYHVEGPVMIFLTTTAIELDEELLNRCLVLTVNETREQTAAIQHQQRFEDTLEGLLANQTKENILKLHRNAQRLLKPLKVVNPYADQLTFLSDKTRTRRDHAKYLTLIKTITLLHQYQRETKIINHQGQAVEYIEVTIDDIEVANQIAHEVLGRTLDELPPQTRRLLNLINEHINQQCKAQELQCSDFRFSRRDIREFTHWGNTQIRVHMDRLTEMEYLISHRGGRGQSFVYELLYDGKGEDDQAHLNGLINTELLKKQPYDSNNAEQNKTLTESKRPQNGVKTGGSRTDKTKVKASNNKALEKSDAKTEENALIKINNNPASYLGQKAGILNETRTNETLSIN
jgi:DNA primase catalytic core